jgi:biopolymer transport protein ExbD
MAGSVGSEDGDIGFQIAPMVDVVFVLMLFFMASAGSQIVERELGINLPGGAARQGPPPVPVIIEISAEGLVKMNSMSYGTNTDKNLAPLRTKLKELMDAGDGKDPVIISPAPDTRHERVIDVLNAAGASGVKNLTFR